MSDSFLRSIDLTFRALLLVVAGTLSACSGDGPSAPGTQAAQVGALVVSLNGLPTGAPASVTVTGPGGFTRTLSATTTLTAMAAGNYTVDAAEVTS